jgi:hypothetical protein
MATLKNPAHEKNVYGAFQAGIVHNQLFRYDLSANYHSDDINQNDLIQIGIVPAGCRMIPQLSQATIPAIEGGTPASDYTIGTAGDPDALAGTGASETARALFGEDWTLSNVVGHPTEPTPIYIKVITADMHTEIVAGEISFNLAYRAWDDAVDELA